MPKLVHRVEDEKQDFPILLRKPHSEDIPFIFNSWLKSYRPSIQVKNIPQNIFYGEHHRFLEKIMKRAECIIACNPDDTNHIFGYVVYEIITGVLVVHYVYVKQDYRRLGVCNYLLEAAGRKRGEPFAYTHETYIGHKLSFLMKGFYNPYIIYNGYEDENEEMKEELDESQTRSIE